MDEGTHGHLKQMRTLWKWLVRAFLAAIVLFVGVAAYLFVRFGDVPAHIVARLACPAVYIESRDTAFALERAQGLGVFPFDVRDVVSVDLDASSRVVTVRSFGLFSSSARHYPGEGCVME
jgi:hypothetical protein